MGLFDFLNPKKAIQQKLMAKVEGVVVAELGHTMHGMTDPAMRRAQIHATVQRCVHNHAAEVVPPALQSVSGVIINKAVQQLTDKLFEQMQKAA